MGGFGAGGSERWAFEECGAYGGLGRGANCVQLIG